VYALLAHNGQARSAAPRSRSRAFLQTLLQYRPCDCAMTPAQVSPVASRHRYYIYSAAQRKCWHT
jgi:hypothetical protein